MKSNKPIQAQEQSVEQAVLSRSEDTSKASLELIATRQEFCGPIPPPEHFEHYEKVLPGAGDRILAMSEKEQAEKFRENKLQGKLSMQGLWLGTIVILALIAVAVYAISLGYSTLAGVILAPIVALAIIYILRHKPKEA